MNDKKEHFLNDESDRSREKYNEYFWWTNKLTIEKKSDWFSFLTGFEILDWFSFSNEFEIPKWISVVD